MPYLCRISPALLACLAVLALALTLAGPSPATAHAGAGPLTGDAVAVADAPDRAGVLDSCCHIDGSCMSKLAVVGPVVMTAPGPARGVGFILSAVESGSIAGATDPPPPRR